jgi:hypothetical protein
MIKEVHISTIRAGDLIMIDDKIVTVGMKDIRHDPFMGTTIFGDCHMLGYRKVKLQVTEKLRSFE